MKTKTCLSRSTLHYFKMIHCKRRLLYCKLTCTRLSQQTRFWKINYFNKLHRKNNYKRKLTLKEKFVGNWRNRLKRAMRLFKSLKMSSGKKFNNSDNKLRSLKKIDMSLLAKLLTESLLKTNSNTKTRN
jgi:hypothetical protein